ncbi:MAG: hypothetical protein ED555_08270 [Allomuricauda sp.]|nr:MAG: hypothetical protein ED555_08270 [Allomuricauda sp.]
MKDDSPLPSSDSLFKRGMHYARMSGPGWIQAAVTLGGGTLVSALYLGVIGGFEFLWLQPLAMLCGVIMLSALSYITLSIQERPFRAAKKRVSPVLAWGWLVATVVANVVFCASQFALGTDAIQNNLGLDGNPFLITALLFLVSMTLIWQFSGKGRGAVLIDQIIKVLVAVIVLAFIAVVVLLIAKGEVAWGQIGSGLLPDFSALFHPTEAYEPFIAKAGSYGSFWSEYIVTNQRNIIIGAFGTAVGINMTFLLPYTILKRKWGKKHRELARFDLLLGLLLPFILGASALIIASASQFHANESASVNEQAYHEVLDARLLEEHKGYAHYTITQKNQLRTTVSQADKKLAILLSKRNAKDLAVALEPFLGQWAQLIFGIGILAMALSTMIVHMMMNGYAFSEAINKYGNRKVFFLGALIPAFMGLVSPIIWSGSIKSALVIPASVIATTLLPIAYLIIVLLMNSRSALQSELPRNRFAINLLMFIAMGFASFASFWALWGKMGSPNPFERFLAIGAIVLLLVLILMGCYNFYRKEKKSL